MAENKKRNFLVHGGILAMAGIIVRIIGMFYRIPLMNIIGSEGNGIYSVAYNIYNIMLVLSSYGLPMAVSKLISARFITKQYKNAAQVFRCSLTVSICTGGAAALILFFGAGVIEKLYRGVPGLAIPLRVLACSDNIPCCHNGRYERILSGPGNNDSNGCFTACRADYECCSKYPCSIFAYKCI